VLLCTLAGTTVLYDGDELGLSNVEVPLEAQRDPMTLRATDARLNRERVCTPMHWSPGPGAGFAAPGGAPWVPVGDRGCQLVVAADLYPELATVQVPVGRVVFSSAGDPGSPVEDRFSTLLPWEAVIMQSDRTAP